MQGQLTVTSMKLQKAWLHAFLLGANLLLALSQLSVHVSFEKSTSGAMSLQSALKSSLQTPGGHPKKIFLFIGAQIFSECWNFDDYQFLNELRVHSRDHYSLKFEGPTCYGCCALWSQHFLSQH